jgi:2-amino-4-hydroxy-6-hydroxymethyldihydropteridine diphosphokinase
MGMRGLAAIALGSNLDSGFGDREANLREAVRRIGSPVGGLGEVRAVSSFYDTEPVGFVEQPRFLNGTLVLETELEPLELMRGLLGVERGMGREREGAMAKGASAKGAIAKGASAKGPRVIDLDLLLYREGDGEVMMETEELTLPHPEMQERWFVLKPLAEVAPDWVHPVLGVTVQEMLEEIGG